MGLISAGTKYQLLRGLQVMTGFSPKLKFLDSFAMNVATLAVERGSITVDLLDRFQTSYHLPIPPSIADGLFYRGLKKWEIKLTTNMANDGGEKAQARKVIEEAVTTAVRQMLLFRFKPVEFRTTYAGEGLSIEGIPAAKIRILDKAKGLVQLEVSIRFARLITPEEL